MAVMMTNVVQLDYTPTVAVIADQFVVEVSVHGSLHLSRSEALALYHALTDTLFSGKREAVFTAPVTVDVCEPVVGETIVELPRDPLAGCECGHEFRFHDVDDYPHLCRRCSCDCFTPINIEQPVKES